MVTKKTVLLIAKYSRQIKDGETHFRHMYKTEDSTIKYRNMHTNIFYTQTHFHIMLQGLS